ncbi:MAG: lysylphosphatidylglycerol synthase transmembrane domain-containing protein [Myxococcaceae bacterium]
MKRAVKLGLSLAITAVCLWWTFKDTRWAEMWASLGSANYLMLLPYLGILTGIHLCRTLRWGDLLSGIEEVKFRKLNEAAAIGFLMLVVLPFRLGEFARPFLIAERSKIRRSAAMTTVVLERIVDGIIIAVMLWVLMLFVPGDSADIRHIKWGANLMFAVFFGGLCFLLFALWQRQRAVWLVRATAGRISEKLADKAAEIVDNFVGAMHQLPPRRRIVSFFFFTAIYWALNGVGMSLLANAFNCRGAEAVVCQPIAVSVFQGFVMLAVLVVGLMIPAAPGGAGTFQAAVLIALSVFLPQSVVNSSGVAYANVLWLVQMFQQISFGLIFMVLSKQSFSDIAGKLGKSAEGPPPPPAAEAQVAPPVTNG